MVRQEIYGYLLTHYAIAALICGAATEADIDPDPLLAKHGQSVQHCLWPGTKRSRGPAEYGSVQAGRCRLWVSRVTMHHLQVVSARRVAPQTK
jgi:hypothetical protein